MGKKYIICRMAFMSIISFIIFACTPMDHYYSGFISESNRIYPGKVDSVRILPGYNRLIISSKLSSDPKVVKMIIYWQNRLDSLEVPIHSTDIGKRLDVSIDNIVEGSYNFELITFDAINNSSIKSEVFGRVYGEKYSKTLNNRVISTLDFNEENNAIINWIPESSATIIGTEIQYTNKNGTSVVLKTPIKEASTILNEYKAGTKITYRAMYLPEPLAIDTFYSEISEIILNKTVNVALHRPVTASDILDPTNTTQFPANAVDGKYATSDPRWVSTGSGEHWLEIDLEAEYSIQGFKTWNGASGYNNPISAFKLQAWVNEEWTDIISVTDNMDPLYGINFDPITTNKVRFYTYNQVRLYEIEIYGIDND